MIEKASLHLFCAGSVATALFFCNSATAATTLTAGDISIIGMQSDTPDSFSFVTWVDLDDTTTIHFTDAGWTGAQFTTNTLADGFATWTSNQMIPAGSAVIHAALNNSGNPDTLAWSLGIGTGDFGNTGISGSGDSVLAFQGSQASPDFIFGITHRGGGWAASIANDATVDSTLPSALNTSDGNFVIGNGTHIDGGYYSGSFSDLSNLEDYKAAVTNQANWTTSNASFSGGLVAQFPNSEFTVIPEPSSALLIFVGSFTFLRRRQRKFIREA